MSDELGEWLSEEETATAIKKSVRTLRQWRRRGIGPPYARFGRTIKYRKSSLVDHFRNSEINPVRVRPNTRAARK
jgi:hypothetical protein